MYISESLAVQRVECVRGRVLYVVLKGVWCSIIILNFQAPIEDKSFNSTNSSCNELQQIFDYIPENCVKICFSDFDDNLDREDFSNRYLRGMKMCMKVAVIMMLE